MLDEEKLLQGVRLILESLPIEHSNRNFAETPQRVLRMYKELFERPPIRVAVFPENNNEMIVLRRHMTWGMCPHHLLPVRYEISIGYIPTKAVLGLSKLARLANLSAGGLVLQERIAPSITDYLANHVGALGSGCIVAGQHDCMQSRGVQTTADVVTSSVEGVFRDKPEVRAEFFSLVRTNG